jgi:hypothetical protein
MSATYLSCYMKIPTTPIIVGEGEPPPSWDPVPTRKGIKLFVRIYGLN